MSDNPGQTSNDDVEGHDFRIVALPTHDDTEGHNFKAFVSAPGGEPDDVEGHGRYSPISAQDDTEGHGHHAGAVPPDDVEGHAARGKAALTENDTEGHKMHGI